MSRTSGANCVSGRRRPAASKGSTSMRASPASERGRATRRSPAAGPRWPRTAGSRARRRRDRRSGRGRRGRARSRPGPAGPCAISTRGVTSQAALCSAAPRRGVSAGVDRHGAFLRGPVYRTPGPRGGRRPRARPRQGARGRVAGRGLGQLARPRPRLAQRAALAADRDERHEQRPRARAALLRRAQHGEGLVGPARRVQRRSRRRRRSPGSRGASSAARPSSSERLRRPLLAHEQQAERVVHRGVLSGRPRRRPAQDAAPPSSSRPCSRSRSARFT